VFLNDKEVRVAGAVESPVSKCAGQDIGLLVGMDATGVKISPDLESVIEGCDAIVDFSNPKAALAHLECAAGHRKPAVIGTTGFSQDETTAIRGYAANIPVVLSPNMSQGVNILFHLVKQAAELLGGLAPRPPLAPATLLRTPPPPPEPRTPRGGRLAAILESGRLRVGFDDDAVPWAFVNAKDEVVGFDAEMAHSLALQLGVRLEFVRLPRNLDRILEALDSGVVDVIMSGTRASTRNAARVAYSQPYAEEALAFLVEDHRRDEFATIAGLRGRRLRIGAAPVPEWLEALQRALPDAEVVPVISIRDFVEKTTPLDAILTSWERACAWSLLHPELAPVALEPRPGVTALAYVLPRDEPELLRVVDTWIGVVRGYERFASARRYWILGQATRQKKPRWSVARNVLGWWKD